MNGMYSDSERPETPKGSARYMSNAVSSANQAAKQFAEAVGRSRGDSYIIADHLEKQIYHAWISGYHNGCNEIAEKFNNYIAMQPPKPIVVDRNEITLSTYKMFIREKIKRDSKGNWWLTIKMWWRFIWIS